MWFFKNQTKINARKSQAISNMYDVGEFISIFLGVSVTI